LTRESGAQTIQAGGRTTRGTSHEGGERIDVGETATVATLSELEGVSVERAVGIAARRVAYGDP